MKTKSFKQIIERVVEKGADYIIIKRSTSYCGCINPDDIIAVEVHKGEKIYVASVSHFFSEPIINVDRLVRDKNGRCIDRWTIGQYKYDN